MDVVLDSDVLSQLNTEKAKALHELSVGLGACGVDKLVNLPQIIVVGDQSSGKSSVLEAISHVRFPVKGGLCTRFATELVLRQGNETRVNVSVKFADKSKPIQSFKRTGFHESDLPDIINEAKESMGFTRAGLEFSKDVLRLEIEGPKMYPLSLVDLPGLFRNVTETQSLGGKEIVDGLVESYMGQKNSIILVVITADNQLASHEALRRVKAVDPDGRRTIGVITKPDRAELSNEQTYVKVAKNQETANKLHLGWHVLRNRTENETSLDKRDEIEEAFFKTTAWASIPPEDRGITSLRKKLSEKLKVREEERNRLGDARASEVEYRSFLLRIAGEVHKLRALLRNFNRAFDHALRTRGSTQVILENEDDEIEDDDIPGYLEEFLERYPYDFPDPEIITRGELNAQLQKQAAANQGLEFPGYANRDLAVQLFKKQAAPWERIAKFHVDRVTTATKAFVDALFTHIVGLPDTNQTTEAILSTCVDHFFDKKAKLLKQKLEELLQAYSQGYALPVDIEFYHSLSQKSSSRLASQINKIMRDEYPEMFEGDNRKKLSEKMITTALASNEELHDGEFGTEKLIDSMLAYYEMSRRTFTDNVINLAIENCLVYDIPNILTPTSINRMSEERLKELAAESDHTVSRRKALNEEIDILSNGLARCQAYRPRKATGN
ncbi:P-loop containing nucleoside triphosphate hydrolase protein [Mariannaea sp. PMI_226]|nr:P-loop containing nucleoside triphosphate hydrolase protein [Mariannaea sp. PMI_226]